MAINDNIQPEIILIRDDLRLRKYDGNYTSFLSGYQNPMVYQNSEGIFDENRIPDIDYVKRMCEYLEKAGELYYIEVLYGDQFMPVGDVTIKDTNPPIAIWRDDCRGKGIGTLVMQAVIGRLKDLGYSRITGSTVYSWNHASQRMHEKLGFFKVEESDKEITYQLEIS